MSDEETAGMSGELVRRVARRICNAPKEADETRCYYPDCRCLGMAGKEARAAIAEVFESLGEPSEGMLEAGVEVTFEDDARLAEMWRAMLSKAKEEAGL